MPAVRFAGELVAARQHAPMLLAFVALADNPDRSLGVYWLAVGAGEPAAAILDPKSGFRSGIGTDAILNAIEDAETQVALLGAKHRVETRLSTLGVDQLRVTAAARNFRSFRDEENRAGVGTPREVITGDVPAIGGFADGGENAGGIERRGRPIAAGFGSVTGARANSGSIGIFLSNVARHVALFSVLSPACAAERVVGKLPKRPKEFANPKRRNRRNGGRLQAARSVCTSIWRCDERMLTIKPTSTSTSPIMVNKKKVDVPARCTSRNSTSMTMNSAIARM